MKRLPIALVLCLLLSACAVVPGDDDKTSAEPVSAGTTATSSAEMTLKTTETEITESVTEEESTSFTGTTSEEIAPVEQPIEPVSEIRWTGGIFNPNIYYLAGDMDENAAADELVRIFIEDQTEPSDDRTFYYTEYGNLRYEMIPSEDALKQDRNYGIEADSQFIGEDKWLIYVSMEFTFAGTLYEWAGEAENGMLMTAFHQGGRLPLVLTRCDDGYTIESSCKSNTGGFTVEVGKKTVPRSAV